MCQRVNRVNSLFRACSREVYSPRGSEIGTDKAWLFRGDLAETPKLRYQQELRQRAFLATAWVVGEFVAVTPTTPAEAEASAFPSSAEEGSFEEIVRNVHGSQKTNHRRLGC